MKLRDKWEKQAAWPNISGSCWSTKEISRFPSFVGADLASYDPNNAIDMLHSLICKRYGMMITEANKKSNWSQQTLDRETTVTINKLKANEPLNPELQETLNNDTIALIGKLRDTGTFDDEFLSLLADKFNLETEHDTQEELIEFPEKRFAMIA